MSENTYDYLFKVSVLGDGGVGKTTYIRRYIEGKFIENLLMTIGVNFYSKIVNTNNGQGINPCKIITWDVGGQARFRTLHKSYLQGTNGAMILFDLARINTLTDSIDEWLSILKEVGSTHVPIILVGTKYDLLDGDKDYFEYVNNSALEIKEKYNIDKYLITSSKTGYGIEEPFIYLTSKMLSIYKFKMQQKDIVTEVVD